MYMQLCILLYLHKCINYLTLDISSLLAKNRTHEVLKHVWIEWRKASGNKYKKDYLDFIQMNNDGAQSLG